jgi:hypothetical protein
MLMEERSYTATLEGYRFGFGGHEKDNEVSGEGNHLAFGDFGLDTRLARRWNVEPLISKYPNFSSYLVFANNPIIYTDPDGFDWILASGNKVTWYAGDYGDTKTVIQVFKATSGHSAVRAVFPDGTSTIVNCQNSDYQFVKDHGPTVEGKYKLNLAPAIETATIKGGNIVPAQGKGIQNLVDMKDPTKPDLEYNSEAWGKTRISMIPIDVKQPAQNTATPTIEDDRDLKSFYFHDSQKGESSGCHEVETAFFDKLKEYKKAVNKEIQVKVEYEKNQSTNGGTKKTTP